MSNAAKRMRLSVILVCGLLWGSTLPAADSLDAKLMPLLKSYSGQAAVAVKHLRTGEGFAYRADEPMPTASLIKVAVMVEAYRQAGEKQIDLNEMVTLRDADKVPGSGVLTQHFSPGMQLSLRDAVRLMIAYSDNTATNLVLDRIGIKSVGEEMDRQKLPNTRIHSKVYRGDTTIAPERSREFGLGSTTASEMVRLLESLHEKKICTPQACDDMLAHLKACTDKIGFVRGLPGSVALAHKTGAVSAVRTEAGVFEIKGGAIALCVLTSRNQDQRWADDNAGNVLCAEVARIVYEHFHTAADEEQSGALGIGSTGEQVETLQRTLNARATPSPRLAVDGDFGPATQSAVVEFQKSRHLEATGRVTPETWKALEPLVTVDGPAPEPDVVNREPLEVLPADPLVGPPFTSSKAWAVGNAATGEVLWGSQEADPLEIASLTKVMTAYVVLNLATKNPDVLKQTVTISDRADKTPGTTAEVRAGDKLAVGELLYGLLLPSGNDAAVALAEHCGSLCESVENAPEASSEARFIAEMNRQAKRLGLGETQFANSHGLPAERHRASARDLVKLTAAAWQLPLFVELIRTRQHGCKLEGPGGKRRNVVWKNTNRLLEREGYLGAKTGTTNAAGACLVAIGERNGERLIVVVLGATHNDARYTDTRNLFRWACQQRAQK